MDSNNQPLGEVFGHLPTDFSEKAIRFRRDKLCPYNNKVPNCTKDKAKDPLGVCCVKSGSGVAITCPTRFRQDWLITADAADFFFPEGTTWTSLTEVRLPDADGKSAGNIDVVLAAYDRAGKIFDFGSLEIQAVYISGNVRDPFEHYMSNCEDNSNMDWRGENSPRPDFLSSSRKRLAPQLMFKGGILHAWNKKMAVALDGQFFNTLPDLQEVDKSEAEVAWFVYDLVLSTDSPHYNLTRTRAVYTKFSESLNVISKPRVGDIKSFIERLQSKVDEKLENPPETQTIEINFEH